MTKDKKSEIDVVDSTFDELATALNAGEDVRMSTRSVVLVTRSYLRGWKEQEGETWRKGRPGGRGDLEEGKRGILLYPGRDSQSDVG